MVLSRQTQVIKYDDPQGFYRDLEALQANHLPVIQDAAFRYVGKDLKSNSTFILKAVKCNPSIQNRLSKNMQKEIQWRLEAESSIDDQQRQLASKGGSRPNSLMGWSDEVEVPEWERVFNSAGLVIPGITTNTVVSSGHLIIYFFVRFTII